MKKKLPEIKKSLKSFILEEDAKVIDKTAAKIAIAASFIALNIAVNADDANAKGHKNHTNHTNHVAHDDQTTNVNTASETTIHTDTELGNDGNKTIEKTYNLEGNQLEVEVPSKAVGAAHGNHYNHINGGKK